jgi:negative regulator of flagellin synthesis FlgM
MKIDDRILNYEITKHLPKSAGSSAGKIEQTDSPLKDKGGAGKTGQQDVIVNFSETSKEVRLAKEVLSSQPDIREEKVAEIKAKIKAGTYRIDHEAVASKLVDDILKEI